MISIVLLTTYMIFTLFFSYFDQIKIGHHTPQESTANVIVTPAWQESFDEDMNTAEQEGQEFIFGDGAHKRAEKAAKPQILEN